MPVNNKTVFDYCPLCNKCVRNNQKGICCDICKYWYHAACLNFTSINYNALALSDENWYCKLCVSNILPFMSVDNKEFLNFFVDTNVSSTSSKLYDSNRFLFSKARFIFNDCINSAEDHFDNNDADLKNCCKYYDYDEFKKIYTNIGCVKHVTLLHLNCRSLSYKFDTFTSFLENLPMQFDIVVLTETWLTDNIANLYTIDGYNMYCKQRADGIGGGICVYVKSQYQVTVSDIKFNTSCFEHFELSINSSCFKQSVIVSAVYRPPNKSVKIFLDELPIYIDVCHKLCKAKSRLIFCGDFNIDLLHVDNNPNASSFIDILYGNNLSPTVHWPTRITFNTVSLIDNIFTNSNCNLNSGIILSDLSDHFPVFCVLDIDFKYDLNKTKSEKFVSRRLTTKKHINNLNSHLRAISWNFITEHSNINDDYDAFIDIFCKNFEKSCPEQVFKIPDTYKAQPWMTKGLIQCCQTRNIMYTKALNGQLSFHTYKTYRNKLNCLLRNRRAQYYADFASKHKKNSKALWSIINNQTSKQTKSSQLDIEPNVLNNFFAKLGTKATANIKPINHYSKYLKMPVCNAMFIYPVSLSELLSTVKSLPSKLSSGYDKIPLKIIKNVIYSVADPLLKIINKSFCNGVFPDALKIAKIIPLFKGGDSKDPVNYRPISVLPSFSKIFEKLMHARLTSFLLQNNSLDKSQHGFRKNYSTCSAIADVTNYITEALDKKLVAIALFVDVSKAFDSLNHNILLHKLDYYGVRGVVLNWFKSYLTSRYHYTVINNSRSLCSVMESGIPQGSILGPLLYIIYVNDIFNVHSNVKCVLYADDTVLIVRDKDVNNLFKRCSQLFALYSVWFTDNKLALNAKKTNYVIFSIGLKFGGVYDNLHFDIHDVKKVDFVKYVGIIIDCHLSWKEHINSVNDKIVKGYALLKKCFYLPKNCLLTMYYSFIYPYLIYGIEFWGCACQSYLHKLIVLLKSCVRLIAHVPALTHCAPLARNLGLLFLEDIYKFCLFCQMYKVYHNMSNSVISSMFTKVDLIHVRFTRSLNQNFYVFPCRTNIRRFSFSYNGVIIWNALSHELKGTVTFHKFKRVIKDSLLISYN